MDDWLTVSYGAEEVAACHVPIREQLNKRDKKIIRTALRRYLLDSEFRARVALVGGVTPTHLRVFYRLRMSRAGPNMIGSGWIIEMTLMGDRRPKPYDRFEAASNQLQLRMDEFDWSSVTTSRPSQKISADGLCGPAGSSA